jgi:putative transposase
MPFLYKPIASKENVAMHSRHRPAHGVLIKPSRPTIVFLTVCTRDRSPWLATRAAHDRLLEVWSEAKAWVVGRYVVMPDHLHLFAAPGQLEIPFDNWVRYWKSQFTKKQAGSNQAWQVDHWDTRLRHDESYEEKWIYVRNNPVRANLVKSSEEWPFQGEMNLLRW